MRRIRRHLSFANVVSVIALFVAISGGTAVALNGTNTVQSDDLGPGAQVKAPDVAANAVGSGKVINESLTGQDVKNQSGVDTCTHGTVRFGELCVGVANEHHTWSAALNLCANLNLRLPTIGEANALARNYDVPNLDGTEYFWSGDRYFVQGTPAADAVDDAGNWLSDGVDAPNETVCVTTPTN
jgi:hypothetical protein